MMVQDVVAPEAVGGQGAPACRHCWMIEPANGPVSQGVCQTCGEVREFKNFVETSSWSDWGLITGSRAESSAVAAKSVVIYMEGHEEE